MRRFLLFIMLTLLGLSFSSTIYAETPAYERIRKTLHDKSWYAGCPECRDHFETTFEEVNKGSKNWVKLVNLYGGCLIEDHRETEAINLWNNALKETPNNYQFLAEIGTAYMRMNDFNMAEKYYLKSNSIKTNRLASYHLAHLYLTRGAGIEVKASQSDKKTYMRQKILSKAEKAILQTIDLYANKDHISRYSNYFNYSLLAEIKAAQGKISEAKDLFLKLINDVESKTDWPPKRQSFCLTELYFNYGQLLYIDGSKYDGLKFMDMAIETAPTKSFKEIKKMFRDLTVSPIKDKLKLQARYPQIKEGRGIPLY